MPCPRIEKLSGVINGFNTIFETSAGYLPGSVRVFRNGILNEGSLIDGWTELGNKRISLNEAPIPGDVMQVYYIPQ